MSYKDLAANSPLPASLDQRAYPFTRVSAPEREFVLDSITARLRNPVLDSCTYAKIHTAPHLVKPRHGTGAQSVKDSTPRAFVTSYAA